MTEANLTAVNSAVASAKAAVGLKLTKSQMQKSSTKSNNTSNNDVTIISAGWQKQSNNTWKYSENNQYITGWKQIDGLWYLFDSTGIMQIGWRHELSL